MLQVAFHTLGCKLNFSETSAIARTFKEKNYTVTDFNGVADIYVLNTCSVTDHADRKCKKIVREAKKRNPNAKMVIIGCYAQLKPKEIIEIPGVDAVFGAAEKFNLTEHIDKIYEEENLVFNSHIKEVKEFNNAYSIGDRTRTFLKVQDGCNYFCSFCTIPLARGRSRSDTIENVVRSVQKVVSEGVQEIVLTGVNLGDFGYPNKENFLELIQQIDKVEGLKRVRISSIEPNLLSHDIIEFVATSKTFMPHFHIPLQSGNDEILSAMRRRYERKLYKDRVEKIKELMPHACIGVDVIVGFPGETDEHFKDTYNFINELDVSYLHVFSYSERPNTTAIRMKSVVQNSARTERRKMLQILSEKKKRYFYNQHLGKVKNTLLEKVQEDGFIYGFTDNYIRVKLPAINTSENSIVDVELNEIGSDLVVSVQELVNV